MIQSIAFVFHLNNDDSKIAVDYFDFMRICLAKTSQVNALFCVSGMLGGLLIFCHANENGDEVGLNDGDAAVLNKYMVRVVAQEPDEKDTRSKTWYLLRYPFTVHWGQAPGRKNKQILKYL